MVKLWDAADQLQNELQASINRAIQTKRPIITHLNADTSWLIQLPRPTPTAVDDTNSERSYFNILIDPWFSGPQSDVASWFSTQWHAIASSVQTIEQLEDHLYEIECLAQQLRHGKLHDSIERSSSSYIDLVAISHEFTDHCHQATLEEVDTKVPVIASDKAASLIEAWKHFETVYCMPSFGPGTDWRHTIVGSLPNWLGVSRITSPGNNLYYHSAILICIGDIQNNGSNSHRDNAAEAIIYTPHGIDAKDLNSVATASPAIETLALMHGLHDVGMTKRFQLNLGAHNALKAQRILKSSYWVGTHDEVKRGGGIISPFLRRTILTLQEAMEKEKAENEDMDVDLDDVNFAELGSGESLLLLH